jgi:LPS-assembly lipoprotein
MTVRLQTPAWRVFVVLLGAGLLLLGGCGFHLRGEEALPEAMQVTYIQGKSQFDELNDDFRAALESHGVRVTNDREEATAILRIQDTRKDRDVLSVDLGGKVLEIKLRRMVRFVVVYADNRPLIDSQTVTVSRDFVFNKDDILAKEREAKLISDELRRDLVALSMLRILAAADH